MPSSRKDYARELEVRLILRSERCETVNLDSEVEVLGNCRSNLFESQGTHQKESDVMTEQLFHVMVCD
jgi:hypothetical protein